MTDETQSQPEAEEAARLMEEGKKRGLKFDKRYSEKRMADMIAEYDAGKGVNQPAAPFSQAAPAQSVATPEVEALRQMVEQQAAQMAKMMEMLAKATAAPVTAPATEPTAGDPLYKVPSGTRTIGANLQDAERIALMEQCTRLGIQNAVPPKAGNDWIAEHISRHLAAKAVEQAILEAQAAELANKPKERLVDIRILPKGDKRLSRGVHIPGSGDLKYSRGEIVKGVAYSIAKEQEDNGNVEILDAVHA